jgi:hypothetical protein
MQFKPAQGELIGATLSDVPAGLSPYSLGAGKGWATAPSNVAGVVPSVTVTTAATVDWSQGGIFQYLLTTSDALALTFVNATVGQTIIILLKQPASSTAATVTVPTGSIVAGTAAATVTLTGTNSEIDALVVTCTAPGVYFVQIN